MWELLMQNPFYFGMVMAFGALVLAALAAASAARTLRRVEEVLSAANDQLAELRGQVAAAHLPRIAKLLTLSAEIIELGRKIGRVEHEAHRKQVHTDMGGRLKKMMPLVDRLVSELEGEVWETVHRLYRAMGPYVEGGPEPDGKLWSKAEEAIAQLERYEARLREDLESTVKSKR
jgi:hypothetical protein